MVMEGDNIPKAPLGGQSTPDAAASGSSKSDLANELEVERYKFNGAYAIELLKATVAFEHAALKPLPLLNGGAIIAALTFAGHTAQHPQLIQPWLKWAIAAWAGGLVAAIAAIFLGYWSQHFFLKASARDREAGEKERSGNSAGAALERCRHERFVDKGMISRRVAYVFALLGLLGFIAGSIFGIAALK